MPGVNDAEVLSRLEERGLGLPSPPAPVASYVPVTRAGGLAFVAGQVPMEGGQLLHPGKLGASVSVEMGQEATARAALQALAALRHHLGGTLGPVTRVVQVTVFVAADPEFVEHLGEEGRHARAAVGVASLPLGSSVEVVLTAEVADFGAAPGS
jgi:enamine deaminase RidA (YjgF/YER057c/UK114 family)